MNSLHSEVTYLDRVSLVLRLSQGSPHKDYTSSIFKFIQGNESIEWTEYTRPIAPSRSNYANKVKIICTDAEGVFEKCKMSRDLHSSLKE